jgi:hypothetical protein
VTKELTWTFGIRDTLNSNPLNPHQHIARLSGSFDSISHDVNSYSLVARCDPMKTRPNRWIAHHSDQGR